jgi:hypothetical protein
MADIDMYGGSNFHLDHGKEDGAAQKGNGDGDIEMFGGSDFHMSHSPESSAQKKKGMSGIDMVGRQGLIQDEHASLYGQNKPTDHGTE